MNDGYALTGGHRLFYRESGSGDPVLFIHPGIADSRMWIPQLQTAPDGFHFVAFDQRGFGHSEVGERLYQNHLDALAVMDHFSMRDAVVVGCSIGASIALQVAIAAPDRVSGLVLISANSPGFEPPDGYYEPPQWAAVEQASGKGDIARVAELDAEIWGAGYGRTIDQLDSRFVELMIEMDLKALASEAAREELQQPGPDRERGMVDLEVPTLVVVGRHDLPDIVASAHDLAGKLPGPDIAIISDAAHLPSLERPEAFNKALLSFLFR